MVPWQLRARGRLTFLCLISGFLLSAPRTWAQDSAPGRRSLGGSVHANSSMLATDTIRIAPGPGIDERLFLLRALENTYAQWPSATADATIIRNWIKGTRLRMLRIQKHAEVDDIDKNIVGLYKDCLALLEDYETFLYNVGALQRATGDVKDMGKIGLDAVGRGYAVGQFAMTNPLGMAVAPYAMGTGVVVAVGSGVWDLWSRSNQEAALTDAKKAQLDDWATRINTRFESTHVGTETVARKLAEKYRWGTTVGFDDTIRLPGPDQLRTRPNDPFAMVLAAQPSGSTSPKDRSDRCLAAARLVPPGEAYDPFRAEFVAAAARLALDGVIADVMRKLNGRLSYSEVRSDLAANAVKLHNAYLLLEPRDPGKVGHLELARALAFAGFYREAIEAADFAKSEWENDLGFAVRYTRLSSLLGRDETAMQWLKKSMALGYKEIVDCIENPDFEFLRKAKPYEFKDLTHVKWEWNIGWATFSQDEITLTNKSAFPISDVTFTPRIFKPDGSKEWTDTLTCEILLPGASKTWKLPNPGITYRGSDYKGEGPLKCKQMK